MGFAVVVLMQLAEEPVARLLLVPLTWIGVEALDCLDKV